MGCERLACAVAPRMQQYHSCFLMRAGLHSKLRGAERTHVLLFIRHPFRAVSETPLLSMAHASGMSLTQRAVSFVWTDPKISLLRFKREKKDATTMVRRHLGSNNHREEGQVYAMRATERGTAQHLSRFGCCTKKAMFKCSYGVFLIISWRSCWKGEKVYIQSHSDPCRRPIQVSTYPIVKEWPRKNIHSSPQVLLWLR